MIRMLIDLFNFRGGMEANKTLRDQFSSAVSTALEDIDVANKGLLSSIDSQYQISSSFPVHFYIVY